MPLLEKPSKEAYIDWKNHYVSRFLIEALFQKREDLKEGLAEGQAVSSEEMKDCIGQCKAYKDILRYMLHDFDYYKEDNDSDEREEVATSSP